MNDKIYIFILIRPQIFIYLFIYGQWIWFVHLIHRTLGCKRCVYIYVLRSCVALFYRPRKVSWISYEKLEMNKFQNIYINFFKERILWCLTGSRLKLEKLPCLYRDTKQEGIENAICHFLAILHSCSQNRQTVRRTMQCESCSSFKLVWLQSWQTNGFSPV